MTKGIQHMVHEYCIYLILLGCRLRLGLQARVEARGLDGKHLVRELAEVERGSRGEGHRGVDVLGVHAPGRRGEVLLDTVAGACLWESKSKNENDN